MKNVCIVGGAGFIGSHLFERLQSVPGIERIVVVDKRPYPWHDPTPKSPRPVSFLFQGDVANPDFLDDAFKNCDTVFHLAANADIAKAATHPGTDFWHGTYLTHSVMERARRNGIQRIVYTSGSGVYGDRGDVPVREDMPCCPVSPYGASKLASEAMISAYCAMFGMTGHVFRFANVVGPRQTHGVGFDFIRKLRTDPSRLEILGNGSQSKSYIHIEDVLNAMLLVIAKQCRTFDVWNVATDDRISVARIAELAAEVLDVTPEFVFGTGSRGWRGDVPVVSFDCTKIHQLGWAPHLASRYAMFYALAAMRDAA